MSLISVLVADEPALYSVAPSESPLGDTYRQDEGGLVTAFYWQGALLGFQLKRAARISETSRRDTARITKSSQELPRTIYFIE